ncbi:hypothetical protein DM992_28370 [Burkholderia sp. JP2-270]|nr:hypothetical protein DM992_28370 [Burkholderia sp. JP2-270]
MGRAARRRISLGRRRALHPHALPGFGAAAVVGTYLLACNACGRCCNSAPTLSLRELLRHRNRFVGAPISAHCRARCLDFIDAQLALIGANVEAALARRRAEDRPATRELRGFAQALERARHALAAMPALAAGTRADASHIDAWLAADPLAA